MLLPELWAHASRFERFQVRHFAPLLLEGMFDMLVHPGVYEVVGLPGWPTWRAAKATPARLDLKHRALRPVAQALIDAGALVPGRIPTRWQRVLRHRPLRPTGRVSLVPADEELDIVPTKGARTRRVLLEAAIERFARDGYRATSVTDIARRREPEQHRRLRLLPEQGSAVHRGRRRGCGRRRQGRPGPDPRPRDVTRVARRAPAHIARLAAAPPARAAGARRARTGFHGPPARHPGARRAAQGVRGSVADAAAHGRRPRRHRPRPHGRRAADDRAVDADVA